MKIKVRPIGLIKRYAEEQEIEAPEGLTCRGLIRGLEIPHQLKMVTFVNGKRERLDAALHDGDRVTLVSLATGG